MTSSEAMGRAVEWATGVKTHRRAFMHDLTDQARAYAAQADEDAAEVLKWTTIAVALAEIEEIRERVQADRCRRTSAGSS